MPSTAMKSEPENGVVLLFALGHLGNDWAVGAIYLIAPAMALSFGLGPAEVGLLITIYGIGAALAYMPAGVVADRSSRRGGLLLATFVWVAVGHVIASYAPDYWTFALLMAIAVMGDAAWHPIATGYLVQRFPGRRARVLGIHAMGGTIGAEVLAPLGVGAVLTFADWRTALQIASLPAALVGLVFLFNLRRIAPVPVVAPQSLDFVGLIRPWCRGQGLRLAVMMVFYNMAGIAIISMFPLYLQTELEYGPLTVSFLFAGMLFAGSLLQPWLGGISDRHGRRALIVAGLLVASASALLAGLLQAGPGAIGAVMVAGALFTGIRSIVLAAAVEVASKRQSATLALAFTVLDGVGAAGALFAGLAAQQALAYAFLLAGGFGLIATALGALLKAKSSEAITTATESEN